MKLLVAVIRPERLEAVKTALGEVGVFRLTVSDVMGQAGTASSPKASAPGAAAELQHLVKLEIAVNEPFVEPALAAMVRGARSGDGRPDDGNVLVLPLQEVIRIRTGERGEEAV